MKFLAAPAFRLSSALVLSLVCASAHAQGAAVLDAIANPVKINARFNKDPVAKTIVRDDPGGVLSEYEKKWLFIAVKGGDVDVLGSCRSACTVLTGYIPKDRLCYGPESSLSFHQARKTFSGYEPHPEATKWLWDRYPADIRGWLVAKGGLDKLPGPGQGYWTMPASDLWQMGYRKCDQTHETRAGRE
jgi:hypothetical protein